MTVAKRFELFFEKLEKAAARSCRTIEEIHLIAVTKNATLLQMGEAYKTHCRAFGENRLQKALLKIPLLPSDIEWHFIGPIQSNKAAAIASCFSVIHSVSSYKIAEILSSVGEARGRKVGCFIQLNLTEEVQKQGFCLREFFSLEEKLLALPGLDLMGLMTMGSSSKEPQLARSCFRKLFEVQSKRKNNFPFLSMGMSEDFEIAIEEGATHLRLGSFLFEN